MLTTSFPEDPESDPEPLNLAESLNLAASLISLERVVTSFTASLSQPGFSPSTCLITGCSKCSPSPSLPIHHQPISGVVIESVTIIKLVFIHLGVTCFNWCFLLSMEQHSILIGLFLNPLY